MTNDKQVDILPLVHWSIVLRHFLLGTIYCFYYWKTIYVFVTDTTNIITVVLLDVHTF